MGESLRGGFCVPKAAQQGIDVYKRQVLVCDSPLLKDYTTDAYAKVVCDMVNEYKPEVLLIGATNIGRDLGPRCAAPVSYTHLDVYKRQDRS